MRFEETHPMCDDHSIQRPAREHFGSAVPPRSSSPPTTIKATRASLIGSHPFHSLYLIFVKSLTLEVIVTHTTPYFKQLRIVSSSTSLALRPRHEIPQISLRVTQFRFCTAPGEYIYDVSSSNRPIDRPRNRLGLPAAFQIPGSPRRVASSSLNSCKPIDSSIAVP